MAFGKRNYKKGAKPSKTGKKSGGFGRSKGFGKKAEGDEENEGEGKRDRGFGKKQGFGGKKGFGDRKNRGFGGGGRKGGRKDNNTEFMRITGLFPSKSGNSYTALVNERTLEALGDIEGGDFIGVSQAETKDGDEIMSLWVSRAK